MLLTFIIAYLVVTILIGVWASRNVKTTGDFMLAGRSLPLMLSSAALFATWFGSETVFGASSQFLEGGLYNVIEDPFGAALCLFLFGIFFARKLYNMNLLTLGDFFNVRYGKTTELISTIFLGPPYVGYIAAQLVAMGLILNVVAGMEVWQGIVLSAVVVTLYTYIGGMWAISVTDFFQSILIILGLVVLAYILSDKAGGVAVVVASIPKENLKFFPDFTLSDMLAYFGAWSVLGLGSIPSQDVFQRAMSAKSASVAVWSCHIAAIMYLTIALLPLFISVCTAHLFPHQVGDDTQLTLPSMVLQHTSLPIQILFFGSLLSAIMSTTSSAILAPAAIFSENLFKPLFRERITDKQLLWITKVCILLFSVVASVMACLRSNIYELVGESSILSLVSLFVPLVLGLYWKRASSQGAILAMISGMISWVIVEYVMQLSIPSLIPATIISLVVMVMGSMLKPPKVWRQPN